MISVVMAYLRRALFSHAMRSHVLFAGVEACMAASTLVEPDCTGRCTWSQMVSLESMASTMSLPKSRGWEVV